MDKIVICIYDCVKMNLTIMYNDKVLIKYRSCLGQFHRNKEGLVIVLIARELLAVIGGPLSSKLSHGPFHPRTKPFCPLAFQLGLVACHILPDRRITVFCSTDKRFGQRTTKVT